MTERTFEEQKKITQETLSQCDYGTLTNRIMVFLYTHLESSVEHAYAVDRSKCRVKTKSDVFAEGCSFYKLVLPFIIGAFIGAPMNTSEEYSRKSSSAKSFGTTAVCRST